MLEVLHHATDCYNTQKGTDRLLGISPCHIRLVTRGHSSDSPGPRLASNTWHLRYEEALQSQTRQDLHLWPVAASHSSGIITIFNNAAAVCPHLVPARELGASRMRTSDHVNSLSSNTTCAISQDDTEGSEICMTTHFARLPKS